MGKGVLTLKPTERYWEWAYSYRRASSIMLRPFVYPASVYRLSSASSSLERRYSRFNLFWETTHLLRTTAILCTQCSIKCINSLAFIFSLFSLLAVLHVKIYTSPLAQHPLISSDRLSCQSEISWCSTNAMLQCNCHLLNNGM